MAVQQFKNPPLLSAPTTWSTLAGALAAGATSLTVASATPYPTDPTFQVAIGDEILTVTAVAGAVFTVSRGTEGTTDADHATGASVVMPLTRAGLLTFLPKTGGLVVSGTATGTINADRTGLGLEMISPETGNVAVYGIRVDQASVLAGAAAVAFGLLGNVSGAGAFNIGLSGQTSAGTKKFGGYFSSSATDPTTLALSGGVSGSCLVASNGSNTDDLLTLYDNTSIVFRVADGGAVTANLSGGTGLPISTGVSGLGSGVATFLATPSSANLASAVTGETGTGALVFADTPTLIAPILGTPTSGLLSNCTGLPLTTGITGTLGVANGGTGAASASITAFNNITGFSAAGTTGTTSTNLVFSTSPTLVTPVLGVATATSLNGNTFTAGTYTLTGAASKVLTFNHSLTLAGTDSTTMTFPTTSATIARTDAGQTFTGTQAFGNVTASTVLAGNSGLGYTNSNTISIFNDGGSYTIGGSSDVILKRGGAAATLQLGVDVNGTATAQTLQAANAITGTDKISADFTIQSGTGTGAGAVSSLFFKTPTATASGTTAQVRTTRLTLTEAMATFSGAVTITGAAILSSTLAANGTVTMGSGVGIATNTGTGTIIATAASQKLAIWGAAAIVQPTTGIAASTFTANTSLIANDTATFDGYTLGQVVKALRNFGLLA